MRCQNEVERSNGRMFIATAQPPSTSPRMRSPGTTTSSKNTSANSGAPLSSSNGRTVMPGVSKSTKNAVMPRCRDSGVPVRVRSTQREAYCARLVHSFWPLTTQSPSLGVARHDNEERSLPVPGSENPWHHIASPLSSFGISSRASSGAANSASVGASTSVME